MNRRLNATALALVLALAGCGGSPASEPDPGPTTTPDESTTSAPATTVPETTTTRADEVDDQAETSAGFCDAVIREEGQDLDVSDPDALEETLRTEIDRLTGLIGQAPAEIRDDFEAFVANQEQAFELFARYDFEIFSVPEEEMEALGAAQAESQARILEFCDVDTSPPEDGPSDTDEPDGVEGFPAQLIPPGTTEMADVPGQGEDGTVIITTDAPYDEVTAYYEDLLGPPVTTTGDEGTREAQYEDPLIYPPRFVISVEEGDGEVTVTYTKTEG